MIYLIILLTAMSILLIWDCIRINRLEKKVDEIKEYFDFDDGIFDEIVEELNKRKED